MAVAIQGDGKIVATDDRIGDFYVWRFRADGRLDPDFDADGLVETDVGVGSTNDEAFAVAVQTDGKVVVAGQAGGGQFALTRYNADGSPDAGFGSGGQIVTGFGAPGEGGAAESIAIQTDGKIVVVGQASGRFALARYNSDGSLDTAFDGDGKVTTDFGTPSGAYAVALQGDGKLVVVGWVSTSNSNSADFALARYNSDGGLDTTFDGDGKVTTSFGSWDQAYAVAIEPVTKKLVVVGTSGSNASDADKRDFAVARYHPDGRLDTSFDKDGKATTDFNRLGDQARGVAVQLDGKVVVAGTATSSGTSQDFGLVRYNANGSLDTSFGSRGKVVTDFGTRADEGHGLALQGDGKLVLGGFSSYPGSPAVALARYRTDGSLDPGFGSGGKVITGIVESYGEQAHSLALQRNDGKILVAGTFNRRTTGPDFGVARYDGGATSSPTGALRLGEESQRRLAGGPADADPGVLTQEDLQPIVTAALARWEALGVDTSYLRPLDVQIADLPGPDLGSAAAEGIRIDPNAAGYGWFVDPTPDQDGDRIEGVDLLTAVAHEIGHLLGREHHAGGVMDESLEAGVRDLSLTPEESPGTRPLSRRPPGESRVAVPMGESLLESLAIDLIRSRPGRRPKKSGGVELA